VIFSFNAIAVAWYILLGPARPTMNVNLETLREEIQAHLSSRGIAVFHGFPRGNEDQAGVYWDTNVHPDYREFVAAAEAAGARLMTMHTNQFTAAVLDDAEDRVNALPRDERREMEQSLRRLRGYIGFTCQIELSFDVAPRFYVFDVRTDWYDELNDMLDQLDTASEDADEDPLGGGYFSKN
jgi:hypothetical protein